jgi:predicted  nucleic acid-binding Zn-ribbon protein
VTNGNQNSWNEYSRLVLQELERLSDNIEGLKNEIQHVKQEIAKMQVREDKVDELKQWKEKVDDVCSPTQLKELVGEVEDLKTFKTKAITIFAAVQVAMGLFAWALKFFE